MAQDLEREGDLVKHSDVCGILQGRLQVDRLPHGQVTIVEARNAAQVRPRELARQSIGIIHAAFDPFDLVEIRKPQRPLENLEIKRNEARPGAPQTAKRDQLKLVLRDLSEKLPLNQGRKPIPIARMSETLVACLLAIRGRTRMRARHEKLMLSIPRLGRHHQIEVQLHGVAALQIDITGYQRREGLLVNVLEQRLRVDDGRGRTHPQRRHETNQDAKPRRSRAALDDSPFWDNHADVKPHIGVV